MKSISIPAWRQRLKRLWTAFLLIGALGLGAFQPVASAHAGTGYAYYWSLTFDFEHGADGVLSVVVGYDDNGAPQDPPLYTQNTPVPCRRNGNAAVAGGVLKLNGGYLSCELDIQTALKSAFAACDALVPGCAMNIEEIERYSHFRAAAKVLSTNPGAAPVFYHEDAAYTINPQTSATQITANLAPHGVIPSTPVFSSPALNVWQSYTAFYSCAAACTMQYGVAGALEVAPVASEKTPFSTPATMVYIGYDPLLNMAAPAGTQIDTLFIDPPNHGNG
jgi:hypothetical protein